MFAANALHQERVPPCADLDKSARVPVGFGGALLHRMRTLPDQHALGRRGVDRIEQAFLGEVILKIRAAMGNFPYFHHYTQNPLAQFLSPSHKY